MVQREAGTSSEAISSEHDAGHAGQHEEEPSNNQLNELSRLLLTCQSHHWSVTHFVVLEMILLPCDAMRCTVLVIVILSVRLSVCLSHSCTV